MANLFEVLLTCTGSGGVLNNRWNYLTNDDVSVVSLSFALAYGFGAIEIAGVYPDNTIIDGITAVVGANTVFQSLKVINIYDFNDWYVAPFIPLLTGTQTGDILSPINALGMYTTPRNRSFGTATKRFGDVAESSSDSGGHVDAAILEGLETLGAFMDAPITYEDEGSTLTFTPVILSKMPYTPPANTVHVPGGRARTYWPDIEQQMNHMTTGMGWTPYTEIRSQVSRQFKRGV